jgi:hypothetical protein
MVATKSVQPYEKSACLARDDNFVQVPAANNMGLTRDPVIATR